MQTALSHQGDALYELPLMEILDFRGQVSVNEWVGKELRIHFTGNIHCIATGKKIRKTFGEGLSYDAWLKSPLGNPAIIHPELSRIHEGIALRDFEWEERHHNQPHYVYLSFTSGVKVGVTRATNLVSRWIDQGASEGIILAQTPYRQLAGLIEVNLKSYFADKTSWQAMLKGEVNENKPLRQHKEEALQLMDDAYIDFISDDDTVTQIHYPLLMAPIKPKSIKLEQDSVVEKRLVGIKGQYLIFEDNHVLNIRAHAGYEVSLDIKN